MSKDSPSTLVAQLDGMHFGDRMRALVQLGRLSKDDLALRNLIADWSASALYDRLLALQTAFGSRDATLPLKALADPSMHMKRRGIKVASVLCSDEQLVAASGTLPVRTRRSLIHELRRRRRLDVIETILDHVLQRDRPEFIGCLPYGPEACVARHIEGATTRMAPTDWARLAKRHPRLVHDALLELVGQGKAKDYTVLQVVNSVLPPLARAKLVLSSVPILRAMLSMFQISDLAPSVQPLVAKFPSGMLELALELEIPLSATWSEVLNDVLLDRLIELNRQQPNVVNAQNFKRLRPERRAPVFEAFQHLWRSCNGFVTKSIVEALPMAQRTAEARRHLRLQEIVGNESGRMSYAALLPWDESLTVIKEYMKSKDVDTRASAMYNQISSARFSRDRVGDALQLVVQRRYENDLVRRSMLRALSELPMGVWKAEHLEPLRSIIADTLAAVDLSSDTIRNLNELIFRLFQQQPDFAVEMVILFVQKRDNSLQYVYSQYGRLAPPDVSQELEKALLPSVHQWMERKEYGKVTALASKLDKHFAVSPAFWQIMEKMALESGDRWETQLVVDTMSRSKTGRGSLTRLVPQLLDTDPSCIHNSVVNSMLQRRMPGLLTRFLTPADWRGKFNPNGQVRILIFDECPQMWTREQHRIYAAALTAFIRDTTQAEHNQIRYIKLLARLHYTTESADAIAAFAEDSSRPVICETAVRALAHLDEGNGVPCLLEALGDSRARIAIYTIGRVLKSMGADETLSTLKSVRTQKVTVLKEIMRLIGDLETGDALEYLLQKEREPGLHVDVRLAILRRLWGFAAWTGVRPVLERAAADSEKEVAKLIVELPAEGTTDADKALLLHLLILTLSHPHPEVRLAALRRAAVQPLPDPSCQLALHLSRIVSASRPEAEVRLAATALFKHYSAAQPDRVASAFAALLPDRKTLAAVLAGFLPLANLPSFAAAAAAVRAVLASDPLCTTLHLRLLCHSLAGVELHDAVAELAPRLHADALVVAEAEVEASYTRKGAQLHVLEERLRDSMSEQGRRLGLAALKGVARGPDRWTAECRRALGWYRGDDSVLVAEAAAFVFPPDVEEDGIVEKM